MNTKPVQHILIVYELIPEELRLFLVPDDTLTSRELEHILKAHGGYTNHVDLDPKSEQADAINCIEAAITKNREGAAEAYPELVGTPWIQRFLPYEVSRVSLADGVTDSAKIVPKTISHIIRTGFLL